MTTSTREQPEARAADRPPWDDDTLGDTQVIDGEPHYAIQDMSFDDAWLRSDTSFRIDKMR